MPVSMRLCVFDLSVEVLLGASLSAEDAERIRSSWSRCLAPDQTSDPAPAAVAAPGSAARRLALDALAEARSAHAAAVWVSGSEGEPSLAEGATVAELEQSLASTVTLAAINARVGLNPMLHAAGLADPATGRAVALVAPSGTGKTTACRVLGQRFSYLTDETVFIDDGAVLPYPKPLSVIEVQGEPKAQRSPDELGLGATVRGARLHAVAILERVDAADLPSDVEVTRIPTADAVHQLVPQMSGAPSMRGPISAVIDLIESVGGLVRIAYSDSAALEPVVARLLSEPPASFDRPQLIEVPSQPDEAPAPLTGAASYRRKAVRQALTVDDRLLLMLPDTLLEVSDLGFSVYSACPAWATLDEIVARVEEEHGSHPEGRSIVSGALDQLLEAGVIEISAGAPEPH
ncbi:ATP-binding protein [Arthrobacter sp. UM1]|uniref:ATP-binding protein n=1 Tax=Arthrobacter sp. UM1 TaxID=2766776 RepID=UPI001CF6B525|nr:ATP-binding protein [Arthrobacter sp. UM1]MCB4208003.1 hypothetical protein [Arthrobacter sp. UM1]